MDIVVVGLSHKTAPVEIRERLSVAEGQIEQAIARLRLCPHVEEAAILSTCNRLEIYAAITEHAVRATEYAAQEIMEFLAEHSQLPLPDLQQHLFTLTQRDAVRHLMWVASGMDSLVIGEGQILAQVKHAYKIGQQYGGVRRKLNQMFKQAITAAKRVRTETSIGTGAVSVSSAAVELAETKVDDLTAYRILIVGAGQMAQRLIKHLLAKGVNKISMVNRSFERVKELIDQFNEAGSPVVCVVRRHYPVSDEGRSTKIGE